MAIKYNKFGNQDMTKDGRVLGRGGPRDLQRRQQLGMVGDDTQSIVIETLKEQIRELTKELANKPISTPAGGYTAEDVDTEIIKAVEQAVKETKQGFVNKVTSLELERDTLKEYEIESKKRVGSLKTQLNALKSKVNRVEVLEEKLKTKDEVIKSKDDVIMSLKNSITHVGKEISTDPDRPKMENIFVDPLDKDSGDNLESFIKVEDISKEEKEDISKKVNKLKNLIGGKLPSKIN